MGLQDGLELAGRSRRVDGRGAQSRAPGGGAAAVRRLVVEGSWKRTRAAHVSIGCLQRAELIVGWTVHAPKT